MIRKITMGLFLVSVMTLAHVFVTGRDAPGSETASKGGVVQAQFGSRRVFSGHSSGGLVLQGTRDRVPLSRTGLAGFSLGYDRGDYKMRDLSAGFINQGVPALVIQYTNGTRNDDYSWSLTRQELPRRPYFGFQVHQIQGVVPKGKGSSLDPLILSPGTGDPVLAAFTLYSRDGKHRIREIGVEFVKKQPFGWDLVTTLRGRKNFSYFYRVHFVTVQDFYVRQTGTTGIPTVRGRRSLFVGNRGLRNPALQGFRFNFTNGSHDLDELEVQIDTEFVTVAYNDKNDDDPFNGIVRWIDFPNP